MTRALAVVLVLAACGPPAPPRPPGTGGGDGGDDDTAEACVSCELIDCEDDALPEGVESEADCEDAAVEQGCLEYTFDDC